MDHGGSGALLEPIGQVLEQDVGVGLSVVQDADTASSQDCRRRGPLGWGRGHVAVGPVDQHGSRPVPERVLSERMGRVTLRGMPQLGITELCLPGPPTTMTLMLSVCSVMGVGASSSS